VLLKEGGQNSPRSAGKTIQAHKPTPIDHCQPQSPPHAFPSAARARRGYKLSHHSSLAILARSQLVAFVSP
jgi:hypothetical protein